MLTILKNPRLPTGFTIIVFAFSLMAATPLPAQERYPAVARLSFVPDRLLIAAVTIPTSGMMRSKTCR